MRERIGDLDIIIYIYYWLVNLCDIHILSLLILRPYAFSCPYEILAAVFDLEELNFIRMVYDLLYHINHILLMIWFHRQGFCQFVASSVSLW